MTAEPRAARSTAWRAEAEPRMRDTSGNDQRPCPACGGRSYEHFTDENIDHRQISEFTYSSRKSPEFMCLRLVRCLACDLVYAPAPPGTKHLTEAYTQAAYDSSMEADAAARSYAKALRPYLAALAGHGAAVDVGAGSGPLLPLLAQAGFSPVIGIEPSQAAIDAAPPTIRAMLRCSMFSADLIADLKPSLLCSFMTLEHLGDPAEFVGAAYASLNPGGMLAVVVHNWRAPINRLLGRRSPIIDVEHLQLFSPRSLRMLLSSAGLKGVHMKTIANAYPLRYWLRLMPLPAGFKSLIEKTLLRLRMDTIHLPLRVGNIMAVGFKPSSSAPTAS